eukprot:6917298-Ditylum_brightwellii.AAC.1
MLDIHIGATSSDKGDTSEEEASDKNKSKKQKGAGEQFGYAAHKKSKKSNMRGNHGLQSKERGSMQWIWSYCCMI